MYHNNNTIGSVNTETRIRPAAHNAKTLLLSGPRGAFLALLRLNIWGMATLLSKRAFLVNEETTKTQVMGQYWWDVQAKWRVAWWNLGGSWDSFTSAVNAGKSKRFLGIKLAPKKIRAKLEAQGISGIVGISSQGIGVVDPATGSLVTAAAILIGALTPIILTLLNNIKKDVVIPAEPAKAIFFEDGGGNNNNNSDQSMAGAGLIGAAILAALYFGTKK